MTPPSENPPEPPESPAPPSPRESPPSSLRGEYPLGNAGRSMLTESGPVFAFPDFSCQWSTPLSLLKIVAMSYENRRIGIFSGGSAVGIPRSRIAFGDVAGIDAVLPVHHRPRAVTDS